MWHESVDDESKSDNEDLPFKNPRVWKDCPIVGENLHSISQFTSSKSANTNIVSDARSPIQFFMLFFTIQVIAQFAGSDILR